MTVPEQTAAERPVTVVRSPYRARAWWGEQLVAESTEAVRVQEPGQAAELHFPRGDVRFDLFTPAGELAASAIKGGGRTWSIEGKVPPAITGWGQAVTPGEVVDGQDVLWSYTEPAAGLEWLAEFAAFDHNRVRVELVDGVDGDDPRDVTVKQFPTWGDAKDLIDILDVRPDGDRRYVSTFLASPGRPVVEASQMLGQAIVAASRHAPGRRVVSAHMAFYRIADAREPLAVELEELNNGRTFTTVTAHISQGGKRRASGTLLLDTTGADVFRHDAPAPPAPGPYESEPYDMTVTGRDLRIPAGEYDDDPAAPVGPPTIDTWIRFRDVPADQPLHAALLAQFTGHLSIAAAMRPHAGVGQWQAHRTLSTGINAIGLSLHADIRADQWLRYHHLSTVASGGMTHSECRVYTEGGALVASFTVDAMVRPMPNRPGTSDHRTAM
ncbi:conserved hypothetical protein [Frankia sp. AiPs1]|uniref:DUF427 domain-containing protein n=1 Tax=Frankia sp. AiPa1 TaxID=573492 RepID=UPI00202B3D28|nr:DUF427 domain-containing protein [Frankia sp. AiPa1]MCL9762678.1 thioesterase family protein [Frankia sp. AiPa1]